MGIRRRPWQGLLAAHGKSERIGERELFTAPDRDLIIYHFMFGKAQTEPCPLCMMWIGNSTFKYDLGSEEADGSQTESIELVASHAPRISNKRGTQMDQVAAHQMAQEGSSACLARAQNEV